MPTALQSLALHTTVPLSRITSDLEAIAERAARIHLALTPLAQKAGIRSSTLGQWKSGHNAVTGMTYWRALTRLEATLEEEERSLFEYLKRATCRRK